MGQIPAPKRSTTWYLDSQPVAAYWRRCGAAGLFACEQALMAESVRNEVLVTVFEVAPKALRAIGQVDEEAGAFALAGEAEAALTFVEVIVGEGDAVGGSIKVPWIRAAIVDS
jgi:hypothetical protein